MMSVDSNTRPMAELVPWMSMTDAESVVLCKDSSLLVAYEYIGMDADSVDSEHVDAVCSMLDRAYQAFNNQPITIWHIVRRRRTDYYPEGDFPDPVSKWIDDVWRESRRLGDSYENRHYIVVVLSPQKSEGRFFSRMQSHLQDGESTLKAAWNSVTALMSSNAQFAYTMRELDSTIDRFEGMLSAFIETLPSLSFRRLAGAAMRGFLRESTSVNPYHDVNNARHMLLDSYLPDCTVDVGPGQKLLTINGDDSKYVAALSLKEVPEAGTYPGMLNAVLMAPCELTMSQVYRVASKEESMKHVKGVLKHHDMKRFSTMAYLKAGFKGGDLGNATENQAHAAAADQASSILDALTMNQIQLGWHSLTVLVYGDSADTIEMRCRDISTALRYHGISPIRESLHLLSAYTGTIPGAWRDVARWSFLTVNNLADMTPFQTVSSGNAHNKFLTEQIGKPAPALTVFSTEYHTPYYFNFHAGDVGHTFLVGPNGAGKSVFVNFLLSQWRKYQPCRIFIFDKDMSCKIPTLLQGGQHINLTSEAGRTVTLNPLALLADEKNWEWVAKWVELLISSRGYRVSSADYQAIYHAIEGVASIQDASARRLLSVYTLLPPNLKAELDPWVGDKPLSKYFDNSDDSFSISDFTCAEMGEVFQNEAVAVAFLEYAFRRIMMEITRNRTETPVPTIIYLEECWFLLQNPVFAEKVRDWLKTLRKLTSHVIMATQSLEDIAQSKVFSSIRDNIPTRIFLPNPRANAESLHHLYARELELNEAQIGRIANATPKRDYFISQPGLSRMVSVKFPPEILMALRSDALAQHCFYKTYDPDNESWRDRYFEELQNAS